MSTSKQCLLVSGTPYSGLPVLNGCLAGLGFSFGSDLIQETGVDGAERSNSKEVGLIHDLLLRDLGASWDMVGGMPEAWKPEHINDSTLEQMKAFVAELAQCDGNVAISDSRLALFFPLWAELLVEAGLDPVCMFIMQHPFAAASVMQEQCGIDLAKGHLIWLRYMQEGRCGASSVSHVSLLSEDLIQSPLESVRAALKLALIDTAEPESGLAGEISDLLEAMPATTVPEDLGEPFSAYERFYQALVDLSCNTKSGKKRKKTLCCLDIISEAFAARGDEGNDGACSGESLYTELMAVIGEYEREALRWETEKKRRIILASQPDESAFATLLPVPGEDVDPDACELLVDGQWQTVRFAIANPVAHRTSPIVFSPLNMPGIVRFASVRLIDTVTGEDVWAGADARSLEALELMDAVSFDFDDEVLTVCLASSESAVALSARPDLPDMPLTLEVNLRVDRTLHDLSGMLASQKAALTEALAEKEKYRESARLYRHELDAEKGERKAVTGRLEELENALAASEEAADGLSLQIEKLESEIAARLLELDAKNLKVIDLAGKNEDLTVEVHSRKEQQTSAEERAELLQKERNQMAAELQQVAAELQQVQSQKEAHLEDKENLRNINAELEARIATLEQECSVLKEGRVSIEEYDELLHQCGLGVCVEELTQEGEPSATDVEECVKSTVKNAVVNAINNKLELLAAENAQLVEENTTLSDDKVQLVDELTQLSEQVETGLKEKERLETELAAAQERITNQGTKIETLFTKFNEQQSRFMEQYDALTESDSTRRKLAAMLEKVKGRVRQAQQEGVEHAPSSPIFFRNKLRRLEQALSRQEALTREYAEALAVSEKQIAESYFKN